MPPCQATRKHSANPYIISTTSPEHISNTKSDFITFRSIDPDSVKLRVVDGTRMTAIGRGDIELKLASGKSFLLKDALYIPTALTPLVSFYRLTQSLGGACLEYTADGASILTTSGDLLATASTHPTYNTPALDLLNTIDIPLPSPSDALVASSMSVCPG